MSLTDMAERAPPTPESRAIGSRIAEARARLGLSQVALAKILSISSGAVGQYEIGRNLPKSARFEAISKALGVTVEWLLTGDDPEQIRRAQTTTEAEALRIIRKLPDDKREAALAMLQGLLQSTPPA